MRSVPVPGDDNGMLLLFPRQESSLEETPVGEHEGTTSGTRATSVRKTPAGWSELGRVRALDGGRSTSRQGAMAPVGARSLSKLGQGMGHHCVSPDSP